MRTVGPILVATLVAGFLAASGVLARSPSAPPSSVASAHPSSASLSPEASGQPVTIPVVGPDTLAEPPDPPIGPSPLLTLRVRMDVRDVRAVRCDHGFTVMASGADRRDRPITRFWTSPDGMTWTPGPTLRPVPADRRTWRIDDLTWFRGDLVAVGQDDRRLAVWRSTDCGRRWMRERDPSFGLGPDAIGFTQGVEIAATADRLLVIGRQGGEGMPRARWAWTSRLTSGWQRIPGALEAEVGGGALAADRWAFGTIRTDAGSVPQLLRSAGGVDWIDVGAAPSDGILVFERPTGRLLLSGYDHEAVVAPSILFASMDGVTWEPVAQSRPTTTGWGSTITSTDGVMVWTVDADSPVAGDWSWIGTSTDGGTTWTVRAGWPELALSGPKAVAVADLAVVVVSAGGDGHLRVWTLPRSGVVGTLRQ